MSPQYSPVQVSDTEMRVLSSSHNDHEYKIFVALPPGYADSNETYPTLYALDADLGFGFTTEIARTLGLGNLPELLIVGIGFPGCQWNDTWPYRWRDYVPPGWHDDPRAAGGAPNFLRFIREDLIPFVSAAYRVDPGDRCFWGNSLGGLFGLYVLLSQPDTFARYVIGSPWFEQNDARVFKCESEYAVHHSDLPARVFMGAGSLEPEFVVTNMHKMEKALRGRGYESLELTTHVFDGETHVSVFPYNFSRGIRTVFG